MPDDQTRTAPGQEEHASKTPEQGDKADTAKRDREKSTPREDEDDPNAGRRAKAKPWVRGGIIVVAIALVAGGVWYWWSGKDIESTDDAYTDGRAVMIAPQVSGNVVTLHVADNQFVHQGDPIVSIDPRQYQLARDQAEAALVQAQGQLSGQRYGAEIARKNFPAQLEQAHARVGVARANLLKAQQDAQRQRSLTKAATTQQEIDAANAGLNTAEAQLQDALAQEQEATPVPQRIGQADASVQQQGGQVQSAQAQLDRAALNLDWSVVKAPQDGWITRRNIEVGNYVTAGQQITALVSPEVWITANFKENQLDRIHPGQHVAIRVDAYPNLRLEGHVDSLQLGSGSRFTAFPPENATGNFVKIVQRVPVKIVIDRGLDAGTRLPLGLSVTPKISLK